MTTLSKAEYLKKYMSEAGDTKPKKRRKKVQTAVPVKKVVKSCIVDDDVDIKSTLPKEDVDPYADEEAPTVADIIDERPDHIQQLEVYQNEKWKRIEKPNKSPNKSRHDSDSDGSPMRNTRHDSESDSDQALPVNGKGTRQSTQSRLESDSDQSIPRNKNMRNDSNSDQSPQRVNRKSRQDSDSDQSPPRAKSSKGTTSKRKAKHSDSDPSPPRKRQGSDSDISPARKGRNSDSDQSPARKSDKKHTKTSRGAKAGLSSAKEMRDEMEKLRRKEEKAFRAMDKSSTGEHAATVIRDQSGKILDMHAEMKKDRDKKEKDEKYAKWSKGLKQQEIQSVRTDEALHEMTKPLARYKDDNDLDAELKDQDRDGDPMLAFMKSKKSKTDKKGSGMPCYKGPAPPPNRFKISPGYRWDGVDRYNGYEKKFFEQMNAKKATSHAAFKWSTEDM